MKNTFVLTLITSFLLTGAVNAATLYDVRKMGSSNSGNSSESKKLIGQLKKADLSGNLYVKNMKTLEEEDLGKFVAMDLPAKNNFYSKIMRLGQSLTSNKPVHSIENGVSGFQLAIINYTTSQNPDQTQYLYLGESNQSIPGVFVIKGINAQAITIELESANGTKSEGQLRKRSGTFLPF